MKPYEKIQFMKKIIFNIFIGILAPLIVLAYFQPATLYLETWEGIKKSAVYTKQQADKLFKDGYKLYNGEMFGDTSITTINSTDTLRDSRTVINNNFTSLNTNKLENSSYYATTTHSAITSIPNLATIGTITSGTWNGTAIAVGYGGTGTTTPNRYSVILGNGADGLTIASSTGSSGQSLVSNGTGVYPSWQSVAVNQGDAYTWTGTHSFAATTTLNNTIFNSGNVLITASSTIASTTIKTGQILDTPTDANDITNKTYVDNISYLGFHDETTRSVTATNATTWYNLWTWCRPTSNTKITSTEHIYSQQSEGTTGTQTFYFRISVGNGVATTSIDTLTTDASGAGTGYIILNLYITNNDSASSHNYLYDWWGSSATFSSNTVVKGATSDIVNHSAQRCILLEAGNSGATGIGASAYGFFSDISQ